MLLVMMVAAAFWIRIVIGVASTLFKHLPAVTISLGQYRKSEWW